MPNKLNGHKKKRVDKASNDDNGSNDDFLDATWDLRFDAFSFSSTLFVAAEGETQLIFSLLNRKSGSAAAVSEAEVSLVKSVISTGGGVFLDDAHSNEERIKKIDDDWPTHRDVHLISANGLGSNMMQKLDCLVAF